MLPDEVRAARETLGMTQRELAAALDLNSPLSKDTIRGWEAGRREVGGPEGVAIRLMLRLHAIDQAKRPPAPPPEPPAPKRPRGRPRKEPVEASEAKRSRGRPRKAAAE